MPAAPPQSQPPLVAALAYDNLCTFEFGCVVEVFALPRPELEFPLYRFLTCAVDDGPLRAAGGITVQASHGLEDLRQAHTILVPGWRDARTPPSDALIGELRAAHERGARLASICSGSFVLAYAGLLDNRRATTHWRYAGSFRELFPAVRLERDVLYVEDDRILTSAGSAAGLDLCLHLVRQDYGSKVANSVARRLVLPPHRDGGQAQFVTQPVSPPDRNGRLAPLLDELRANLTRHYTLTGLADMAGTSERSLLRRFREATGATPNDWLITQRVRRAQELLETSQLDINTVAYESGFGSPESLRHHFRRLTKTTPARYRKSFGEGPGRQNFQA